MRAVTVHSGTSIDHQRTGRSVRVDDDIIVQRFERRKDNSQKAFGPHFGQQNLSLLSQYLTPNRDAWPIAVDGIVMDRQKVIDIIDRKVASLSLIHI